MRGPLFVRCGGAILGLRRVKTISQGAESLVEHLHLAVEPKNHVTQLRIGAFEKRYLGLNLFNGIVIHHGSVAASHDTDATKTLKN
jgi:hypothetical protein